MDFAIADAYYKNHQYFELSSNPTYYLANQFVCRSSDDNYKQLCKEYFNEVGFLTNKKKSNEKLEELYLFINDNNLIQTTIKFLNKNRSRMYRIKNEQEIISQLKDINIVSDEMNPSASIDAQIFRAIQKANSINDIEEICESYRDKVEQKIFWMYFNVQSTRLIEDIFRKHERVTPLIIDTRGLDFMIDTFPIDLKITKLPKGFKQNNDEDLIYTYFKEQGEQRFGTENRLFIILNESKDRVNKLETLTKIINNFINNFDASKFKEVSFEFNKTVYKARGYILRIG